MNMKPLTPDITVEELIEQIPEAPGVLRRFGIICIQCGEPVWGTLGELAKEKGITDLTEVLRALNEAGKTKEG
jgi:hypothetical protein